MCFISNIQKNSFLTAYHTMLLIRRYTRAINSRNTPFNVASRINSRNLVFLLYSAVTRLYLAMNSKWASIVLHIPVCTAICSTIADNPGDCALEFGACLIFAPVTPAFARFFAIFRCVIFAPASRYINSCVTRYGCWYGNTGRKLDCVFEERSASMASVARAIKSPVTKFERTRIEYEESSRWVKWGAASKQGRAGRAIKERVRRCRWRVSLIRAYNVQQHFNLACNEQLSSRSWVRDAHACGIPLSAVARRNVRDMHLDVGKLYKKIVERETCYRMKFILTCIDNWKSHNTLTR